MTLISVSPSQAQTQRCAIPREARDIWRCERGSVIGPENVIIRLPIPETDPEALYEAGIEAANREDWRVAIAYFTAAHQRAHLAPRYMYNLGLAHARAGHQIPAIGWLSAYLIAAPDAPNRAEIWRQIATFEATARQDGERLWAGATAAANTLPVAASAGAEGGVRWSSYGTLAFVAARSGDFVRVRAFLDARSALYVGDPAQQLTAEDYIRYRLYREYAREQALLDGDLAAADALSAQIGDQPSGGMLDRMNALRRGEFVHSPAGGAFAPEFSAPSNLTCNENCDLWRLARSGDQQGLLEAAEEILRSEGDGPRRWTALAALGRSAEALAAVTGLDDVGFGSLYREMHASMIGEVLLLAGDTASAERAQRIAQGYALPGSQVPGAARLAAFLLAEQGQSAAAVDGLDARYSRGLLTDIGAAEAHWAQQKFDAAGLIAEFLLNRGRAEEALSVASRLDSLRRLRFYELLLGRVRAGRIAFPVTEIEELQRATLAEAAGGFSTERRAVIENAVIVAMNLSGPAYDTRGWLGEIGNRRSASEQISLLAGAAEQVNRAPARLRAAYAASGGEWGR